MEGITRCSLRIDDARVTELLDSLDASSDRAQASCVRKSARYTYRVKSVLVDFPRDNVSSRYAVPCRNLSSDGIGFLMGQFVYPGSRCRIRLVSEFNYVAVVSGKVARCRYIGGTAGVHELGVFFDKPIDIELFHRAATEIHLLLVDDDPTQQHVLAAAFRKHGADVVVAGNAEEALQHAHGGTFGLVLVNTEAKGFNACELIREIRAAGYVRPISGLSLLNEAELGTRCHGEECAACAPVTLTDNAVADIVHNVNHEPLISSLAQDPEMAAVINQFVTSLPKQVNDLEGASRAGDHGRVMRLVRRLKVFAEGCGFEIIVDAAEALEASASAENSANFCPAQLSRLVKICLAARPASVGN